MLTSPGVPTVARTSSSRDVLMRIMICLSKMAIPTLNLSVPHNCSNHLYGCCETAKKKCSLILNLSACWGRYVGAQNQLTVDSFKANALVSVHSLKWKITK